jgi:asparagine synthase (glutamine-hydrolysing)
MCGIFSILNNTNTFSQSFIQSEYEKKKTRGSISSKLVQTGTKCFMGYHSFQNENIQPYNDGDIFLLFDGEIYNTSKLYHYIDEPFDEKNPSYYCIPFLYQKYGMEHTLRIIDGIFSFILIDNRVENPESILYVVRDHYGQKPLYILHSNNTQKDIRKDSIILFSSELKTLSSFYCILQEKQLQNKQNCDINYRVDLFPPGTYSEYFLPSKVLSSWEIKQKYKPFYHRNPCFHIYSRMHRFTEDEIAVNIEKYISNSVEKICLAYHSQPMACLLSGGVDSPIIAALVNQYCIRNELPQLETYTIGFEDSEEFKYARKIAEQLKTNHTEVIMTEEDVIRCIPEVIRIIETYDMATVRASIPNYLLGKFISENSKAKVVFNGDGADEIFGGYLYLYAAENSIEFDREINKLLEEYHLYDGLRSERTMVVNGLEPRSPFIDIALIQYYLSLPPQVRFHRANDHCDKYYLRLAFTEKYHMDYIQGTTIPRNILWKMKEEWADSMDSEQHSLIRVIEDYAFDHFFNGLDKETSNRFIQNCFGGTTMEETRELQRKMFEEIIETDPIFKGCNGHLLPQTMEQYLYRKEFEKLFPGFGHILPRYWMPKYLQDITDPSARKLSIYPDMDTNEE